MRAAFLIAGAFFSGSLISQGAEQLSAKSGSAGSSDPNWAVGTRIVEHTLLDDKRQAGSTFLGHLGRMDYQENLLPTGFFTRYRMGQEWNLDVALDSMAVEVVNIAGATHDPDGELSVMGPQITAAYHLRSAEGFEPYIGAGLTYMFSSFDHATWHHLGYESEADWESVGSPQKSRGGKRRFFEFDNGLGWLVEAGMDYRLDAQWSLNLDLKITFVSIDGHFYEKLAHSVDDATAGSFPFDNVSLGAGVLYHF